MKNVYVIADNIVSPLGYSTTENLQQLKAKRTGIRHIEAGIFSQQAFYASIIDSVQLGEKFSLLKTEADCTRLEKMMILSVADALSQAEIDITGEDTLLLVSTTKGNIDLLAQHIAGENNATRRIYLWSMARHLANYFSMKTRPMVVSCACISGVLAITSAARLIQDGQFKNVIVVGGDIISEFVVSGFLSFRSISDGPCKPFDKARSGLSLGEGCGTIVLSGDEGSCKDPCPVIYKGGASGNDANHISAPSRTGEGLYRVIRKTFEDAQQFSVSGVEYISAHGTATLYNDESESISISRAGLESVPVNSLKGYWGHTLGAAGIIESIAAIHSIKDQCIYATLGYEQSGVSPTITIASDYSEIKINNILKTASGFGGCNAAIIFGRAD